MKPQKSFSLFGEKIEILVSSEMSGGKLVVGRSITGSGAGPVPHTHAHHDEFFTVMEGRFDILHGEDWIALAKGESYFIPHGTLHTFRNVGEAEGVMLVSVTPGGLDEYLERLSAFSLPEDIEKIHALSQAHGIQLSL